MTKQKPEPSKSLKEAALEVRENAYAPHSNFKVGAALRTDTGEIFVGCNVENVAYPEGTCAEAGAIAAMVAAGQLAIAEIYIVAAGARPVTPCGGCRQKLAEFAGPRARVIMATTSGKEMEMTMADLLPGAFGARHMAGN